MHSLLTILHSRLLDRFFVPITGSWTKYQFHTNKLGTLENWIAHTYYRTEPRVFLEVWKVETYLSIQQKTLMKSTNIIGDEYFQKNSKDTRV